MDGGAVWRKGLIAGAPEQGTGYEFGWNAEDQEQSFIHEIYYGQCNKFGSCSPVNLCAERNALIFCVPR
jgi:hypothetical protein